MSEGKKTKKLRPSEKQARFLTDSHKYVGYGGARAGGKSWAVRVKAAILATAHPGIKILIVRRTYRELINNHIEPLREIIGQIAKYNKSEKVYTFPNGSTIWFGYCDCDGDLDRYQGAEYDVVFIDEATQLKEEWIKKIILTIRAPNGLPKRAYFTMNPGGPSHDYFKRVFLDRRFNESENPEDYSFIKALVTDNKALMAENPDYVRELRALPRKLREAWLYGNWDIYEGQFFEDFRAEPDMGAAYEHGCEEDEEELRKDGRWCHVIAAKDMTSAERRNWKIYRSYDFGYARPFSCAWWAVDYDGTLYRILEFYGWNGTPNEGLRWDADRQFEEIARIEREHPWLKGKRIDGVADPAIWNGASGISVAEAAAAKGVYFKKGINDRIAGWMQCHYRLQFDDEGYPRMYVFENCTEYIRTIPQMMYSKNRPEDLDTDLEDHIADEWRYMCMSRPLTPQKGESADAYAGFFRDPLK